MDQKVSTVPSSLEITYTCADFIIDRLINIDVEYIFGIPGGAIEPLYNAISRRLNGKHISYNIRKKSLLPLRQRNKRSFITPIVTKNECAAACMADGYTRETGKLSVCCATTGPGSTNLITGVATAYTDNTPMLIITPQTALPNFGRRGLQESSKEGIDTVGMFEHCTRYNDLVSHPEQLAGKLHKALITCYRRPRGPAHLSIPVDIMNMPAPIKAINGFDHIASLFREPFEFNLDGLDTLKKVINNAKKTVIFIGEGCGKSSSAIVNFAEKANIAFVTSPAGKSWVTSNHPLYRGVFGFAGHETARHTLLDPFVDVVLAVGASFSELSTGGWNEALLNDRLIHIDSTVDNFHCSPMARLHLPGNINNIFSSLAESFSPKEQPSESLPNGFGQYHPPLPDGEVKPNRVHPAHLMNELPKLLPDNTRFLIDTGNAWAWSIHYLHPNSPDCFRISLDFGAMGWAISAAIGTALGNPDAPAVCITGDGSFLMSSLELTTAVANKVPVIFVILNDGAYGMIKHGQRLNGAEQIGFKLPDINYAELAGVLGANGITIDSIDNLSKINFEELLSSNRPTVIDVHIDEEAVPPMKSRLKVLKDSSAQPA